MHIELRIPLKMRTKRKPVQRLDRSTANSSPVTLIEHVRQKRAAMKLSQSALGRLIGYEKNSISRWELEKIPVCDRARLKLMEWLGFDPEAA